MKKIVLSSVSVILICLTLGSCAINPQNTAFSHKYIVSALGIENINGEYSIYMEAIIINSEDYNAEKTTQLLVGEGNSVESAFNRAIASSIMPLEFSHCAVTVMNFDTPAHSISELCSFLETQVEFSLSMLLVSAVSAKDLLSAKPLTSVAMGYDIATMTANRSLKEGINFKNQLFEICQKRRTEIPVFALPFFTLENKSLYLNGICLYQNDSFSMRLSNKELPFYSVACDLQSKGEITVNEENFKVEKSCTVCRLTNRNIPQIRLVCDIEISNGEHAKDIFKSEIGRLFQLSQEFETDIFGIGNLLSKKENKYFNKIKHDYTKYYKNFELLVTVK